MKKKYLLALLPALLVLSGCNPLSVEAGVKLNLMSEDTVAHEEGAQLFIRESPYRAALTSDFVKIGYQLQFDDKSNSDKSDDVISIRFVAALKGNVTSAFWHRGLAQPNSSEGAEVSENNWKYKFNDNTTHESSVFYTALNNGGVRIAAGEEGEYKDYSCFAIYTLMNIPYEAYKDSYLAAYITLNGENTINSQGIAVKIEKENTASKNRFYFDAGRTGHFLEGTVGGNLRNGSDNSHTLVYATEHDSGAYFATYNDLSLNETDSFGSFYYATGTCFQFFGYNSFVKDTAFPGFEAASLSEYVKPKSADTFTLYVSRDHANKLYGSAATTAAVTFSDTYDVGDGNGIFIVGDMTSWLLDTRFRLDWHSGNSWSNELNIPIGARVKFVVGPYNGPEAGNWRRWESGDGHIISSDTISVTVNGWDPWQ